MISERKKEIDERIEPESGVTGKCKRNTPSTRSLSTFILLLFPFILAPQKEKSEYEKKRRINEKEMMNEKRFEE